MKTTIYMMDSKLPLYVSQDAAAKVAADKAAAVPVCTVSAWHWAFDGSFQRQQTTLHIKIPVQGDESSTAGNAQDASSFERGGKEHEINLSELDVFPIEYASAEIVEKCRRRDKTFWKCRHRRYVSYRDSDLESIQNLASALDDGSCKLRI